MLLPALLLCLQTPDQRAKSTLSQMTLDEKIDILSGVDDFYERGVPRLGVPRLKMSDGPAGVRNYGPTTAYAAPVCLAASWDPDLATRMGEGIGRDARSRGVHIWLGPGVNLARIPQNGRNFEYFGEDPVLAGRIVTNVVKGVQSQGVVATVKHFACNNHENDRNTDSANIDERTLRELYLKPFEAAVRDGGAWAVMCSYNKINGTYTSENDLLLNQILKHDWGFKGIVMSDWGAVHSTLGPIKHGLDLEMPGGYWINRKNVKPLIENGEATVTDLDAMAYRILKMTYGMGFDKQTQEDASIPKDDPQNEQVALQEAREGTVLLKNRDRMLPLDRPRHIIVVGPNAEPAVTGGGGSAYTTPATAVSLLKAIKETAPAGTQVEYEPLFQDVMNRSFEFSNYTLPDGSQPGLRMETFDNMNLQGSPSTRRTGRVRILQRQGGPVAPREHFSVRWTGNVKFDSSGTYLINTRSDDGIRVWLDDQPVIDDWNDHGEKVDSENVKVEAGRSYRLKVEYYQNSGDAIAQLGFFPLDGTLNKELPLDKIRGADAIVASVGFSPSTESEGQDRPFALSNDQQLLLSRIVDLNPHVVVVNNSGAGVDMTAWVDKAGAILQAWYPGGVGNRAIAEILFGKTNPSGKLPTTFPRTLKGTYYETAYPPVDHHVAYKEGLFMGYRWFDSNHVAPLFPFGFGLSYTTFRLSGLHVKADVPSGFAKVSMKVTNTGKVDGDEVVQVYVHPPKGDVSWPEKELKAFQRVSLKAGETKVVNIPVRVSDFAYFDVPRHDWVVEPGRYQLLVGTSSRDLPLTGLLDVK